MDKNGKPTTKTELAPDPKGGVKEVKVKVNYHLKGGLGDASSGSMGDAYGAYIGL